MAKTPLRSACALGFATFVLEIFFFVVLRIAAADEAPRFVIFQPYHLKESKKRLRAGDATLAAAIDRLKRDADRALKVWTQSVTHKESLPPSGDKHDYMSIAPYWWPNPGTGSGLPYVRRDGDLNPERDPTSDRKRLDQLVQGVRTLALAYYFTENENHADRAAKLLRAWFLDAETKMNPHLRYAQAIPGRTHGRAEGIIETHNLPELIDAAALLEKSKSWTRKDRLQLQDWFNAYLRWLRESPEGIAEAKAQNNHGTWYDVQVASFALFTGQQEIAKAVLENFSAKRIGRQVDPDGRQPRELARAQSWHYSVFNLEAFFNAAAVGEKVGIDLWNNRSGDDRGLRNALDWLIPFATGARKWTHKQLSPFQPEKLAPLLQQAAFRYREPAYLAAVAKLPRITGNERWRLLYPNRTKPAG